MVSSIKAKMPAKEHTDNCANLAIAKRCDKCRKLYENEKKDAKERKFLIKNIKQDVLRKKVNQNMLMFYVMSAGIMKELKHICVKM